MGANVRRWSALALVAATCGLAACGAESSGPSGGAQVSLSVATRAGGVIGAPVVSAPDTVEVGGDVLVLEKVELVLREIELGRRHDGDCDSIAAGGDDDACEELSIGPLLLDLPLGPGAERRFSVAVEAGTYDEIEFELHKPEDDPGDDAFLRAHPELEGISVRATGTFNGRPFTFTTDLNAEQELELAPPLVVAASGAVDVTLFVDVRSWFVAGGGLVDPALAVEGGPMEAVVKANLEQSFRIFEDNDHDGESDD